MDLRFFKTALEKFSSEFDSAEVLLKFTEKDGTEEFGLVCSVNYASNFNAIILADEKSTQKLLDQNVKILKEGERP